MSLLNIDINNQMLPSELMRYIAEYLDYDTRVSFNVAFRECQDDTVVRKISSDQHHIAVKLNMIEVIGGLDDIDSLERLQYVNKVLDGFCVKNDDSLLRFVDEEFRSDLRTLIERWEDNLRDDVVFADTNWRLSRGVIKKGRIVRKMLEDTRFERTIEPKLFQAI